MSHKIEKNLSEAFSVMLPDDLYQRIEQKLDDGSPIADISTIKSARIPKKLQKQKSFRYLSTVAAACLVLVIGLWGGGFFYQNYFSPCGVIDIDVNPSIEIITNRQNKVLAVTAVNEDAEALLDGIKLKHSDLKTAVHTMIGTMVQEGYIGEQSENSILVSVNSDSASTAKILRNLVLTDLNETLTERHLKAQVLNQTIQKDHVVEEFARDMGISVGKATLVIQLAGKDNSLSAEALAGMSLWDIAALVQEKHIFIGDLVDYDSDDSIWETISDAVETGNAQAEMNRIPGHITPAKAKALALEYAGLTGQSITFVKVEPDYENGKLVYEVEFLFNGMEYEYELDPIDGKIVDGVHEAGGLLPVFSDGEPITIEQAKAIAFAHLGVSRNTARKAEVEHKVENGREIYEVEVKLGDKEYSVEISAVGGVILSADYDKED